MQRCDVVVVGAGFAGMYALHRLRQARLHVRGASRPPATSAARGGGTAIPGARCDIESLDYSYSFSPELEQEWEWTERYATQPEILRYANHVADRFDLRRDIQFDTRVDVGDVGRRVGALGRVAPIAATRCRRGSCVMATGCLSTPEAAGDRRASTRSAGRRTTRPAGRTRASTSPASASRVIGTGSSGIQAIPLIAEQAAAPHRVPAHPDVLDAGAQRPARPGRRRRAQGELPGVPRAGPDDAHRCRVRRRRPTAPRPPIPSRARAALPTGLGRGDAVRRRVQVRRHPHRPAGQRARGRVPAPADPRDRRRSRGRRDACRRGRTRTPPSGRASTPATSRRSTDPTSRSSTSGPRRSPRSTPTGIRTTDEQYDVDVIVFATGFDAHDRPAARRSTRSVSAALTLREKWSDGPRTYLGLAIAGFPNLFIITGPGSPSVLTNMIVSIEQHVDWIADLLVAMGERGATQSRGRRRRPRTVGSTTSTRSAT